MIYTLKISYYGIGSVDKKDLLEIEECSFESYVQILNEITNNEYNVIEKIFLIAK